MLVGDNGTTNYFRVDPALNGLRMSFTNGMESIIFRGIQK